MEEGGRTSSLFFLVSGRVRVSRGGIVLADLSDTGDVFGEVSVLLDRPNVVDVRMIEPTTFRVAEDAVDFIRKHPDLNLYLARTLAKRVDAMVCYLANLKQQYGDDATHLGMVDDVLGSLLHLRR